MIPRAKVGPNHVKFAMKYSGVCHSDVHMGMNDLGGGIYPMVPGHELLGQVTEVGPKVTKVKVGDYVGIGCIIESCLSCGSCKDNMENYCENGMVHTYTSEKKYGLIPGDFDVANFGGYSGSHVAHEHFIVKIPSNMDMTKAAPILCAGVTMYSPLCHWGATTKKNMHIGIIGIGGLGTMGLKLAKALGHTVYAISTSPNKKEAALKKGADHFVVSSDPKEMANYTNKMDLILNTISADHECMHYLGLLRTNGTMV